MRGGFGIPFSQGRSLDENKKPFAFYLATKIKEALDAAGAKSTIVKVPSGLSVPKVIERINESSPGVGLIVMMYQSRYDVAVFNPNYGYNFELIVVSSTGKPVGRKTFKAQENNMELSDKYDLFDMMAEIYKKNFDIFLNDPEIKNALTAAAAGG